MAKSIKADANTMFKNMMKQEAPVANNSDSKADDMDELDYVLEEEKEEKEEAKEEIKVEADSVVSANSEEHKTVVQNETNDTKNQISEAGYAIYTRKQLMDEVYNDVKGKKKTQNFRMHADGAIENALRLGKKSCGNSFSIYMKKLIAEDYLKNREKYENM